MASTSGPVAINEEALASLPASERKELQALLGQVTAGFERNPLEAYIPHDKQVLFHEARTPVKAFIGGNRSGKSHCGVCDDLIQALDAEDVPEHLRRYKRWEPPFYCRIVTPDLVETMPVILEKLRRLTPPSAFKGGSFDAAYNKQKRRLHFANGSWFSFMTYEMDVDKFGGADLHRVHYDEEPSGEHGEGIRKESRMRLIDYGGDELFTFTPLFGLSWVYDKIWECRNQPNISVVQVDMDDNPHLSEDGKREALSDLTEEERQARKSGQFVHFKGLFYDEFRDAFHTRKAPAPEDLKEQTVVCGIDPGLTRTGVVWIAFDNDNAALAFEELYESNLLIPQIAGRIKEINARWGLDPSYIIDPSARNRATVNAEQIEAEYAREGVYCAHGQNARGPGILEVKRRLQQGTLVVSKDCHNLIWEFGRYRKDPNSQDEFAAIKQDDHLLDALRYVVMSRAWSLPKQTKRRDNWNRNPLVEPAWHGPEPTDAPPLGAFS